VQVEWLDGATSARPGARFRGRNQASVFRWARTCEIVACEPYQLVWRTVSTHVFPDSSEWAITLRPATRGTNIQQTFRVVRAPKVLDRMYAVMIPAHRDRTTALAADLRRLGERAATTPRTSAASA
jgi:hypothetical protein